tara:strand:+ start:387 stop:866 length:480 start_codon:yes stop_codon:yes gene_type:complete
MNHGTIAGSTTKRKNVMGNRAVITIRDEHKPKNEWSSLYLHWNGGRDSVEPFLYVANLYGVRCDADPTYGIARLSQIIGNTLGGTLSIGVASYKYLDTNNYDNGVYVISDWKIIEREYFPSEHKEQNYYDFDEMVAEIRTANDHIFHYEEPVSEIGETV